MFCGKLERSGNNFLASRSTSCRRKKKIQFVKAGQLTTSVAARKALLANITSRSLNNDSGPSNPEVVEVNDTSESETELTESDDDPDGEVIFDNQEHILDRPFTETELHPAIDPHIPYPGCYKGPNNGPNDEN